MYCDTFNKKIRERQDFFLYNYQKFLPPLFYKLFSTSQQPNPKNRLKYPHVFFENMVKLNRQTEILKSFQAEMSPMVRVYHNSARYNVIDLLPFFTEILQPNIRSIALQLFTKIEKDKFENLIKTMLLFSLNYRQEKTVDGQYCYVLEPPVDDAIKLSGMKQHKQLGYVIKQQLAREITLEKVKLADKFKNKDNDYENPAVKNKMPALFKNVTDTIASPKPSPLKNLSSLMKEKQQNLQKKDPPKERADKFREKNCFSNFFIKKERKTNDETEKNTVNTSGTKNQIAKPLTDGVWLKYKEGFINAVRYNIKISDLI